MEILGFFFGLISLVFFAVSVQVLLYSKKTRIICLLTAILLIIASCITMYLTRPSVMKLYVVERGIHANAYNGILFDTETRIHIKEQIVSDWSIFPNEIISVKVFDK